MMKPGDHCKVRLVGIDEWVDAEVALHSANGQSLALYLDEKPPGLVAGAFSIHRGRQQITLMLSLSADGTSWCDVMSGASFEVLVTA